MKRREMLEGAKNFHCDFIKVEVNTCKRWTGANDLYNLMLSYEMLHFILQTRASETIVQKTRRFPESLWHAASKKVWTNISWITLQNLTLNWIKLPVLSATDEDCVTCVCNS